MAVFYKSDSIGNYVPFTSIPVEDYEYVPRPLGTMLLVDHTYGYTPNPVLIYSVNAGTASFPGTGLARGYNGVNYSGNVSIPLGGQLYFYEFGYNGGLRFAPDGSRVLAESTPYPSTIPWPIIWGDNLDVAWGTGQEFVMSSDGTDVIATGNGTAGPRLDHAPSVSVETDGIDFGTRFVLTEEFHQRPLLPASLALPGANQDWELAGTNAAEVGCAFRPGGGVTLTTGALANDQMIVRPHTAVNQTAWQQTSWTIGLISPRNCLKIVFATGPDITNVKFGTGIKGSNTVLTTADSGMWIGYASDGSFGAPAANLQFITRNGPTLTIVDTGVAVAPSTVYRVVIDETGNLYVNGSLVAQNYIVFAAGPIKPFLGLQNLGAASRQMSVMRYSASRRDYDT